MKKNPCFAQLLTFSLMALVLTLGLLPQRSLADPVVIDRMEASVNSGLILLSDVAQFRKTVKLRAQLDPLFAGTAIANKGAQATDREIVQFLVDEKIITQLFPINDAEVEQEINSIQANLKIDRPRLKSVLAEQGFTFDTYFDLIRSGASKRNLIDRDIRTKVSVSDEDVKNYYYNHYAKTSPEARSYHLQIVSFSFPSYKTTAAAKEAAQRALKDLKGGESFEEVAKRYSDGPTASTGGDLGDLTESQIAPLIRDQLKKLQIGQVSDVFGGAQAGGYFILKLRDVKTADDEKFNRVKEEIRSHLLTTEYQHQITLWLERQRQSSFIHFTGETAAPVTQGGSP